MIGLPKSTECNKRIPKQKFYGGLNKKPTLKEAIKNQIKSINWRHKIAPSTMNIGEGHEVDEIEVIEIKLNQQSIDEDILRLIDKEIPYYILFVLSFDEKYRAVAGHKKAVDAEKKTFKVDKYYYTEWLSDNEIKIEIDGIDMDAVWDGFVRQVGEIIVEKGKSLEEQIEADGVKEKIQKDIEKMEKQARNDKQPKKKFLFDSQIKELKKQLSEM